MSESSASIVLPDALATARDAVNVARVLNAGIRPGAPPPPPIVSG